MITLLVLQSFSVADSSTTRLTYVDDPEKKRRFFYTRPNRPHRAHSIKKEVFLHERLGISGREKFRGKLVKSLFGEISVVGQYNIKRS